MSAPLVIYDFRDGAAAAGFSPIDDAVMGGRSWSRALAAEGCLVFTGQVSLEDGGGFASIRSRPRRLGLPAHGALAITARGDGRRYKVNLRTEEAFDGVTWQAVLELPAGGVRTVTLPFTAFEPRFRGRPAPQAAPLDPVQVVTIGFLVGDRQAGTFRLEVARVEAVAAESPARPDATPSPP